MFASVTHSRQHLKTNRTQHYVEAYVQVELTESSRRVQSKTIYWTGNVRGQCHGNQETGIAIAVDGFKSKPMYKWNSQKVQEESSLKKYIGQAR